MIVVRQHYDSVCLSEPYYCDFFRPRFLIELHHDLVEPERRHTVRVRLKHSGGLYRFKIFTSDMGMITK